MLIAVTTGMRSAEIFGLNWSDAMYSEELLAVRAKLKGGRMRYVPVHASLPPSYADTGPSLRMVMFASSHE